MAILAGERLSPRIDNGVIYFVQGDTFELQFELDMYDADGEPIILDGGTFHFKIQNDREGVVAEWDINDFVQPQEGGLENSVFFKLLFDSETVANMYKGKYHYTISYDSELVYDPEDDTQTVDTKSTMFYRNTLIVE